MKTWEEYRTESVQQILELLDEGGWYPSPGQIEWLTKYATGSERRELAARNVHLQECV
jgi:hypothetical protein